MFSQKSNIIFVQYHLDYCKKKNHFACTLFLSQKEKMQLKSYKHRKCNFKLSIKLEEDRDGTDHVPLIYFYTDTSVNDNRTICLI